MKIKNYAPIVIPTLNRYDTFRQCFESLEECTGAEHTDVYIGLDFPVSESHKEGWQKIDEFLTRKECKNKFKKLVVYRRNYNLGIRDCYNNTRLLWNEVSRLYDRFIFTEDDNVFSKNFLEYINKGLELYKNDNRVLAICGYKNDFEVKSIENNHFAQHSLFQAWGFGIWVNRFENTKSNLTPAYFRSILYSHKKWYQCFKYWPHWTMTLVRNSIYKKNYLPFTDTNLGFYLINENKCVICPTVSKVRNLGFSELATTTSLDKGNLRGRAEHENNLIIDNKDEFEFIGNPYLYEDENSKEIAAWDGKWETNRMRSLWKIYPRIIAFRILAFLGIV